VEDLRPPPRAAPPPTTGRRGGTGPLPALEELLGGRRMGGTGPLRGTGQAEPAGTPTTPLPAIAAPAPQSTIYSLQIGPREPTRDVLKRFEHMASGVRLRLQVANGAISLRTAEDCTRLKEVAERQGVRLTIMTADAVVLEQARSCGIEVQDLRRHKPGDAPVEQLIPATTVVSALPAAPPPTPEEDGRPVEVAPGV
jgi:hypothetical protein